MTLIEAVSPFDLKAVAISLGKIAVTLFSCMI
jgi:hypothetical protein